nr:putative reverse transcriptase domain-containing protein [Tanacetum cinerariifolium]
MIEIDVSSTNENNAFWFGIILGFTREMKLEKDLVLEDFESIVGSIVEEDSSNIENSLSWTVADSVALFSRAPFTLLALYSLLPHFIIKCLSDESLVIPLDELYVDDKLHFVEEPVEIIDREIKKLNRSRIPIIKVRWNSKRDSEFTWEREDQFKKSYPHLFTKTVSSSSN